MKTTIPPDVATALLVVFFMPAIFAVQIFLVACGYYSPVRDDQVPASHMRAWWAAQVAVFLTAAILWSLPVIRQRLIKAERARTICLVLLAEWMAYSVTYAVTALATL